MNRTMNYAHSGELSRIRRAETALEKAERDFQQAEQKYNAGMICFKKLQKAKSKLHNAQDKVSRVAH